MKITKDELLLTDLVIDNQWLDEYVLIINLNYHTEKIPYKTQLHHVIPRFYYLHNGLLIDNSENNIVNLSIKDHIIAHYYLAKCTSDKYHGLGYASINYILRNQQINNLPELNDFIDSLDGVDELYSLYRLYIAYTLSLDSTRLKKSVSVKNTILCVKNTQPDLWNKRNLNLSDKLKGRRKSEEHRLHISESRIANGVAIGENNGFYGKSHTLESKDAIGSANSKCVIMLSNDSEISFSSITKAVLYLKSQGINTTGRRIALAANENELLFGYMWMVIDNGHKKPTYTEESKLSIISNAESRGYHISMIDLSGACILRFTSRIKAGLYVVENKLVKLHPKNAGIKIYNAAISGDELYGYIWTLDEV